MIVLLVLSILETRVNEEPVCVALNTVIMDVFVVEGSMGNNGPPGNPTRYTGVAPEGTQETPEVH